MPTVSLDPLNVRLACMRATDGLQALRPRFDEATALYASIQALLAEANKLSSRAEHASHDAEAAYVDWELKWGHLPRSRVGLPAWTRLAPPPPAPPEPVRIPTLGERFKWYLQAPSLARHEAEVHVVASVFYMAQGLTEVEYDMALAITAFDDGSFVEAVRTAVEDSITKAPGRLVEVQRHLNAVQAAVAGAV